MSSLGALRKLIYKGDLFLLSKYLDKYNVKIGPDDNILTYPIKAKNNDILELLINKLEIDIYAYDGLAHKTARIHNNLKAIEILNLKYHPNSKNITIKYPLGTDFVIILAPNSTTNTIKYLLNKYICYDHVFVINKNGKIIEFRDIYHNKDLYISVSLGGAHFPLLDRELETGWRINRLPFEQIMLLFKNSKYKQSLIERILRSSKIDTSKMNHDEIREFANIIEANKLYLKYDVSKIMKNPLLNLELKMSDPSVSDFSKSY